MAFDDLDLERTQLSATPPPRSGRRRAIVVGAIALALAVAGYVAWIRTRPAPSADVERMAAAPTTLPTPSGTTPAATGMPALGELDPVLRRLIGELSSSPLLSKWLATGNLARQMAALVDGAAGGRLPLRFLAPLRPAGAFSVAEHSGRTTIAPGSYARYDAMADVIAALDPATVVRVYRTLAPRLEEAHGELGEGQRTFDSALRDGLRRLSETPIPDGPVAVTARGGIYVYADPRLEALSPAEKVLLRSGPANARRVQTQLSAIAAAMGPSAGAPVPSTP
ncbi:MAG: DUF3014 domain-containing protein [Vicinamibacteria bacterium]|nr:DUF3014 domain-containing protein [Vicinamibacteria bacterium]